MTGQTQASPRGGRRHAALAALLMLLLSFVPHLYFFYQRGAAWNGTLPLTHGDETPYAAYLNARFDGRPRRADPYTGRDDEPGRARHESFFSIQFLPPAVLAAAARPLGATAEQAFFALTLLAAALAALALQWMMRDALPDARALAAAAIAVLCLGSAPALASHLVGDNSGIYLPFLRRYVPAFAFPFLFAYCALVWRAVAAREGRGRGTLLAAGAGAAFAVLVYTYFYLWTAALAWLFCLTLLWTLAKGEGRREGWRALCVAWAVAAVALVPYFVLLSRRAPVMDEAQLMVRTHAPDFSRLPELIGLVVIVALAGAARARRLAEGDRAVLFVASLAALPLVVFNQQVLTGRSLQPNHYDTFGVNYLAAAAAAMAAALVWRGRRGRAFPASALVLVTLVAVAGGAYQALQAGRRYLHANTLRDSARPAMLRLRAKGRTPEGLDTRSLIYCTDLVVAGALPGLAPQPVLWAPQMYSLSGVDLAEDRERMSLYLYLQGVTFDDVDPARFQELDNFRNYFATSLISRARHHARLRVDWTPITPQEVEGALRRYADFVSKLDRALVEKYRLSYVLTSPREGANLANFDRWYERGEGERVGEFIIYPVSLRAPD